MTRFLRLPLAAVVLMLATGTFAEEFTWTDGSLEDLLQLVKNETGKRFVYDPALLKDKRVKILAPDFHRENFLQLFEAVLEMNQLGLAASGDEKGEFFKIIPSPILKLQPIPIFSEQDLAKLPNSDRLVTQIFTLKNIDPTPVGQVLQPLIHIPAGEARGIPNTNVLVVTEYASNMRRLAKIVEIMDREQAPPRMEIIPLKFATSTEMAPRLNQLLTSLNVGRRAAVGAPPQAASLLVTDDPRTNSIIIIGYESDLVTLKGLIEKLDKDLGADQNTIRFFPLQHRNARDLATIIKAMYTEVQDAQRSGQPPGFAGNPRPPNAPATAGSAEPALQVLPRIVADEVTNAIIAIGPPRSFKELKETIERLDTRRPQVFIEATIMEVGEDSTQALGVQLASVERPENRSVFFGGTNFGFTQPVAGDPNSQAINPAQGLIAGVFKDSTSRIPIILRALQTNNDADVIATPSLMTNDNQKATVTISDQQPTTTTQTGTATTNTTFNQFVEAKTSLDITPHISEESSPDGAKRPYLRLEITQTLEKFVGASVTAGVPPPKESRTTTTTVTIPDGATVVISGFTRKDRRNTVNKVPILGDIPFLGFFFRNKTTVDVRTNLFVFITPHIITDLDQLEGLGKTLKTRQEWDDLEKTLKERYFEGQEPSKPSPPPEPAKPAKP